MNEEWLTSLRQTGPLTYGRFCDWLRLFSSTDVIGTAVTPAACPLVRAVRELNNIPHDIFVSVGKSLEDKYTVGIGVAYQFRWDFSPELCAIATFIDSLYDGRGLYPQVTAGTIRAFIAGMEAGATMQMVRVVA